MKRPVVRVHIWMETGGETLLGLGRAQLLERIEEFGSLKKAAESLGMSYRAAWGKIKHSERTLGFQLLDKSDNKSGFRLTVFGKCLADAYRSWFEEVERRAFELACEKFPFDPLRFCDRGQTAKDEPRNENAWPDVGRLANPAGRRAEDLPKTG